VHSDYGKFQPPAFVVREVTDEEEFTGAGRAQRTP